MKTLKRLKGWTIATMIFAVLFLVLSFVCVSRPVGFGEWLVMSYEDMTCELGHTTDEMYDRLAVFSFSAVSVCFLVNQILYFVYVAQLKKTKEIKVEKVERVINVVMPKQKKPKEKKTSLRKQIKEKIEEVIQEEKKEEPAKAAPVVSQTPVTKADRINELINRFKS